MVNQKATTGRMAEVMRPRPQRECSYECLIQNDFNEPRIEINSDPIDGQELNWSKTEAWAILSNVSKKTYRI